MLFLLDGQNVFASRRRATWRADEIAGSLIARGSIPPVALVAIHHAGGTRRWAEYLPYPDPHNARARRFEADRYGDLVVRRVVPEVLRLHPALERARSFGIGGSSYGAVAALHTAMRHPGTFDRLLIESAPLWVGGGRMVDDARVLRGVRAWVAVGTRESSRRERNTELAGLARRLGAAIAGRSTRRVRVRVVRGAPHHETAWATRLPAALRWLFGDGPR